VSERTCSKWVARYRAEGQLVRSIGLFHLSLFGIGATIGAGIFIVLTQAVPAGPAVIWSFAFAGLVAGLTAICYRCRSPPSSA